MPTNMKSYEYPRVYPPSSKLHQQDDYLKAPGPDDRFSWVQTPADAERRMWQQNNTDTQAQIPPLPQIPDHLNPSMNIQRQQTPSNVHQPSSISTFSQQQPNTFASMYGAHTAQTTPILTEDVKQQLCPAAEPQEKSHNYADPVKSSYRLVPRISIPVVPDANPLSLPSPTKSEHGFKSTNMPIILPSDSSQFTIGSYTPTPQPVRGGSWQHGLCSCAEPSICMTAMFCPCIIYGKTQYRLDLKSEKKDPTNMLGYSAVNGSCMAFGFLCGINSILATIQHARIRKAYGMDGEAGNVAGDCLKSVCCCCCVVAQDEKEISFREEEARRVGVGFGGRKEGYIPPPGMSFAPPPT